MNASKALSLPAVAASETQDTVADPRPSGASAVNQSYGIVDKEDWSRLEDLWLVRTTQNIESNYPIGPGDVLEVNAQYVDELKSRIVRVGGDGNITLPLLGTVHAVDLSEDELSDQIAKKLKKYIYNPEVQIFVRKYHSHQVAVVGAVKSPGLIILSDPQETVLDMLKEAGGTTNDAGDAIVLFPGAGNGTEHVGNVLVPGMQVSRQTGEVSSDNLADVPATASRSATLPQNLQPVIIPLRTNLLTYESPSLPAAGNFVEMPVRPGDLILVPGGGDVMVTGWVNAPGHFPVGSNLTVLEAIAAAGGPLYAGDQSDVQLIRTDPSGTKRIISVNLSAIRKGEGEDPPVFANDVIDVPYSAAKIGPYMLYGMIGKMGMGVGVGGSIPW
jgi:polysaccharide export outer membrane protein